MEPQLQHPLLLPLHLFTIFLTFLLPPFPLRRHLSIQLIVLTFLPLTLRPISADPAAAYGAATLWVITLRGLTLHVFHAVPEATLFRPSIEPAGAALSYGLRQKAGWALSLITSVRGVGWNNGPILPARSRQSKRGFLVHAAVMLAVLYLLLDLARTWMVLQPYCQYGLDEPGFRFPSQQRGLLTRLADVAANGISGAGYIAMQYHIFSMIAVGILGQPMDGWVPLFGNLWECDGVATLWGNVWHGMLRASLMPWARKVADLLGARGRARWAVAVVVAFAISGAGHAVAVHTVDPQRGGGAISFFAAQALGIGLESAFAWAGGLKKLPRLDGFVWTLMWLLWTCSLQADELVAIGLFRSEAVPFSVVRWALGWEQ
jgi:hypothetical protein